MSNEDLMVICRRLLPYYGRVHGFMAGHIHRASMILAEGRARSKLRVLSVTANVVASGLRGLIAKMIREEHFNLVITTTGTVDHDIAKAVGVGYFKGDFRADDLFLHELGVHRLGNIFIPEEGYGPAIERFARALMSEMKGRTVSAHELLWEAGKRIEDKNSILKAAWDRKVPIVLPGFFDGSFGTGVLFASRAYGITVDLAKDQELLSQLFFSERNKPIMALIIGGGISKHHVIWWGQFAGGLDYVIYVTTAVEYDGSLSGAHPREAVSWGKIRPEAKSEVVYGDATIVLPILLSVFYCEEQRP